MSWWFEGFMVGVGTASPRPISTGQLHPLRGLHFRPIYPVVVWGPYLLVEWETWS